MAKKCPGKLNWLSDFERAFIGGFVFFGAGLILLHLVGPPLEYAARNPFSVPGTILLLVIGGIVFIGGIIRWAMKPYHSAFDHRMQNVEESLELISKNLMISETAKRIAFRKQDRQTLKEVMQEDIAKGDFEAAVHLVDQMVEAFGEHEEMDQLRQTVLTAQASYNEQRLSDQLAALNDMIDRHEWEHAGHEAARIEKRHPNMPRAQGLIARVKQAREDYKHNLERRFLVASQRDEVDLAMSIMRELDKYLTEKESEPLREAARGVISKKRENLAVQFKLAVHDKEWQEALRVGREIVTDFANSKMAGEVTGMMDLLEQRAAEQTSD